MPGTGSKSAFTYLGNNVRIGSGKLALPGIQIASL